MSVLCGKCHNPHDTVDDVKICYGLLPRQPVVPYSPHPPFIPSTVPQRQYVERLGGNVERATALSKAACSAYIDQLKRGVGVDSPTVAPAPPDPKLTMFDSLLPSLPDGRYAMRMDETEPFIFYRVKRHTKGRLNGCLTIQTQHSERLMRAAVKWRSGEWYFEREKQRTIEHMLLICLDSKQAGFNYAEQLNRCCICGKDLTDDRSRYYGIGPDCETRHLNHIEWVIDRKDGLTYEQHRARLFV